jgi:hypothetical protein
MKTLAQRINLAVAIMLFQFYAFPQANVWVTHSTEKILPNDPSRNTTSAKIKAAKNEFEAFQIVTMGTRTNVSATATVLKSGDNQVPAPHLFREAYINCTTKSGEDGAIGNFPDALIPDVDDVVGEKRNAFPFNVPASENRVIWVEYFIPENTVAGVYEGTVTINSNEGSVNVPVTLTVWNFTLPSTSSVKSNFGMYSGDVNKGHSSVSGAEITALRLKYSQVGLDHRISISALNDGDVSINHVGETYGSLMEGTAPTQLKGAKLTTLQCLDRTVEGFKSWVNYAKSKGWYDRLFDYTCDEPTDAQYCSWASLPDKVKPVRDADPNLPTLVTTSIQDTESNNGTNLIDILVPRIDHIYDKSGKYEGPQRSKYDSWLAGNKKRQLWLYQCCASFGCGNVNNHDTAWASYAIDHSAIRSRAMDWLIFQYDVSGELYWETTWAYNLKTDPWVSQFDFGGNGDGTLFYPGTVAKIGGSTDIPVASIRLKMIRESKEDYEYLKLVCDNASAKEIASKLFPNPWTQPNLDSLFAEREQLANKIVACNTKSSDTQAPSSPTGLASSSVTQTSFTLSWTASTDNPGGGGVRGYDVYKNGVYYGWAEAPSTSIDITGLSCGTAYDWQVDAADAYPANNVSEPSAALKVTTSDCSNTNLLVNKGFEEDLSVGWNQDWGNNRVDNNYKTNGNYSLTVGPDKGGRAQKITKGYEIGKTYTLSAKMVVNNVNAPINIGAACRLSNGETTYFGSSYLTVANSWDLIDNIYRTSQHSKY